jgi:hypothetical protein
MRLELLCQPATVFLIPAGVATTGRIQGVGKVEVDKENAPGAALKISQP